MPVTLRLFVANRQRNQLMARNRGDPVFFKAFIIKDLPGYWQTWHKIRF